MHYNFTIDYLGILVELRKNTNISKVMLDKLERYGSFIFLADVENGYSKPMVWIGMYIALASLCCILAMVADLIHGFRSRKLWFPCKYFTINAFSLSMIAVAKKLPVDLSSPMLSDVEQSAKVGSMAFMCTMMANLSPCLATMASNALLANITALGVLVITLVVNIYIQIQTDVVASSNELLKKDLLDAYSKFYGVETYATDGFPYPTTAIVYVTSILMLLIMQVCSSLAILKSKQIIEVKYQRGHEAASKDLQQSTGKDLTFERLKQHVSNYLIMARSGSPQFIIACSVTTTASGVISVVTTIIHTLTVSCGIYLYSSDADYISSDYRWSMFLILIVQFVGVILGTIAPLSRCFATLSFKMSIKSILNRIKVFKVESYWTQKLSDWKHGTMRIPIRSRKLKVVIMTLRNLILNIFIKLQEGVVVVCKLIVLVPIFLMICVLYCLRCLKLLLQAVHSSSGKNIDNLEHNQFVLRLENEMELADRPLKGLSKSMNRLIQKGQKKQPTHLKKIIKDKSTKDLQRVKRFYSNRHHVHCSLSKGEYQDCWSLSVVTLTTIAVTLRNIEKLEVESLMKSVTEGLEYIALVEENLNAADDYVSIQKAAKMLWLEVDVYHTWLGDKLEDIVSQVNTAACQVDTTQQIVHLFLEKAKTKINEGVRRADDDSKYTSICANSMCRITETIIDDKESYKRLFDELSSRIADIMAACLTNLPRVIVMKCHTSVIEKREECVQAAAQLLGESEEIINMLQECDVPSMNPDDLPFIDKWRAYLSDP